MGTFLEHNIFVNFELLETSFAIDLGKGGHRQLMKIRLLNSDQYLSKNVKLKFGNM